MDNRTIEGDAFGEGSPARPEGESASRDDGSAEEETSETLANEADRSSAVSIDSNASPPAVRAVRVTRATMRLDLDLRRLSPKPEEGAVHIPSDEETRAREMLAIVEPDAVTGLNAAMRAIMRIDTDALDVFVAHNGRLPRTAKEWPAPFLSEKKAAAAGRPGTALNLYAIVRRAAPELSGGLASALARVVMGQWIRWRWETCVLQKRSPPHFKVGYPIPVRGADVSISPSLKRDGSWRFSVQLVAGVGNRIELPIITHDARQREVLHNLSTGQTWKIGAAAITRDRLRPARWYLRVSYTRLVEEKPKALRAAMNRGVRCFFTLLTETGDRWIEECDEIEAFLKQMNRRRRAYQRTVRGSNRKGHGRKRTLLPIEKLQGIADRWRRTKNQTYARRIATWLETRGVTDLELEDFAGIRDGLPECLEGDHYTWERVQTWPYDDLGRRVVACLEEVGIRVHEHDPRGKSQRCPSCGYTARENIDIRRHKLVCAKCGYVDHLDVTYCKNALASAAMTQQSGANESTPLGEANTLKNITARKPSAKGLKRLKKNNPPSKR